MILTEQNYHSPEASMLYMGASQYKAFKSCPAAALAACRGEWKREESISLLEGSYVDAYFSHSLELFRAQHPELFKKDGGLKAEYVQAEKAIQRIERDQTFMRHLSGKPQVIMTGIIGGVPFKIKADFVNDDNDTDLKYVKDFEPIWSPEEGRRVSFIEYWGYDIQGAIYQEIVLQNLGKRRPFIDACATKQPVTDIGLFSIPQRRLDEKLDEVIHLAPEFSEMKLGLRPADRCERCDYCKATKVLTGPVDYTEVGM